MGHQRLHGGGVDRPVAQDNADGEVLLHPGRIQQGDDRVAIGRQLATGEHPALEVHHRLFRLIVQRGVKLFGKAHPESPVYGADYHANGAPGTRPVHTLMQLDRG